MASVKESKCELFNKLHPVGSTVTYVDDSGEPVITNVKHPAEVMGSHTPVVWLKGVSGAYSLDRVLG